MGELAKIDSFSREVAIAESIEEIQLLNIKGEAMAEMAKKLDIPLRGQNKLGRTRIELTKKLRELIEQKFSHGGDRKSSCKKGNMKEDGISEHESSDAKIIKEEDKLTEEVMIEIEKENEVITPKKVASKIREKKRIIDRESRKQEFIKKSDKFDLESIEIYNVDFNNYSGFMEENSIDAIITDPPYPGEFLYLWQTLFTVANRILKPSKFLICYSGQMYLDKIFKMNNDLIYYWMANIIFSKKPLISGRNIINEWKPILIFQKPPFKLISDTISDTISFNYSERDLHDKNWGQTIKPFEFLIEKFTNPGDLIFEPFAGTGTTLIACKNLKRKCIGTEKDTELVKLIKGRLVG